MEIGIGNIHKPSRKAQVAHSRLREIRLRRRRQVGRGRRPSREAVARARAQVNLTAASPRRLDSLDGFALNIKHLHVLHVLHG